MTSRNTPGVDTAGRDHAPAGSSPWPQPGEPMPWPRLVVAAAAMAATVAALTLVTYTAASGHPATAAHALEITAAAWLVLAGLGTTQVVAARTAETVPAAELALWAALLAAVVYAAVTDRPVLAASAAVPYLAFDVVTVIRPRRLLTHARTAVVRHLSRCEDCGASVPDTVPVGLIRRDRAGRPRVAPGAGRRPDLPGLHVCPPRPPHDPAPAGRVDRAGPDAVPPLRGTRRPRGCRVRLLVTGPRTWTNPLPVWHALSMAVDAARDAGTELVVVHGACGRGADAIAAAWCTRTGVAQEPHRAQWRAYGRRAGMVRNTAMVRLGADACVAFIRDGSPGATHCAMRAASAGIPVTWHRWEVTA